ncbi:MAG: hypothetical protein SGI87_12090 [Flavobacteriales bacterium]|nr:hypothetical protein [Flavobacteriales bacterium]
MASQGFIIRSFALDGFGIWNCDDAIYLESRGAVAFQAKFCNSAGETLPLCNVNTVFSKFNGIRGDSYKEGDYVFSKLLVMPNDENAFWAVYNDKIYYVTTTEFRKKYVPNSSKLIVFTMQEHSDIRENSEEIRKLLAIDEALKIAV